MVDQQLSSAVSKANSLVNKNEFVNCRKQTEHATKRLRKNHATNVYVREVNLSQKKISYQAFATYPESLKPHFSSYPRT